MAVERLDIVIREDGSRQVKKSIREVGDEAGKTGKAVDLLKKTLAFAGIGLTVAGFAALSQEGIEITNVIKNATTSQAEFNAALAATQRTAIETGTSTHALAELYDTLATAGKDFKVTQQQTSSIVDTVAKAFAAEGKSAAEAGGAITGLSRALLSGTADMRGFMSILNQSNLLAEAMADQFGLTAGKFVEAVKAGKVSSEDFFKALLNADQIVNAAYGNTSRTLAQAFGSLRQSLIAIVTDTENATGVMGAMADVIIFIAKHLNIVIPIIAAFGVAWVAAMVRASLATGALREAMILLNLAFAQNPFVAILSVLVAVTAAIYAAYKNWAKFAEIVDRSAVAIGIMSEETLKANQAYREQAIVAGEAAKAHQQLALTGGQAADAIASVKAAADDTAPALRQHTTWLESVRKATEALGGTFDQGSVASVRFGDSIASNVVQMQNATTAASQYAGQVRNLYAAIEKIASVSFDNGKITSASTYAGTFSYSDDYVRENFTPWRRLTDNFYGPIGGMLTARYDEMMRQDAAANAAKLADQPAQISPTVSPQSVANNTHVTAPIQIITPNPQAFGASQDQIQRFIANSINRALQAR